MIRLLLIFFILSIHIFALSDIKIKAKQNKDLVNVKILIKSPMRGIEQAKKGKIEQDYINHISASVGNRIVYDTSLSAYIYQNPIIKFNYKYKNGGDILNIIATNNKGKKFYQDKKIKIRPTPKPQDNKKTVQISFLDYRNIKPNLWQEQTIDEALRELYGHTESINGKIEICSTPEGPYHKVTINIKSKVLLESLLVLTDANPRPVVAVFNTPTDTHINYEMDILMLKSGYGNIIIIGKGVDGVLYKTSHNVNVWSASCDGGGDNEVTCYY
jgi:predicted secreted protein